MGNLDDGDMASRIARFSQLKPLPIQSDSTIPLEALDVVYARKLLPVIGFAGGNETALSTGAPIQGAAGITITMAVCPPNTGPSLHSHKATYETFTVLKGRFEFSWGDLGEHKVVLEAFDTFSIPPLVNRAFRNVGEVEGVLQVVISGGQHDASDISMAPQTVVALKAKSQDLHDRLAASGIRMQANGS